MTDVAPDAPTEAPAEPTDPAPEAPPVEPVPAPEPVEEPTASADPAFPEGTPASPVRPAPTTIDQSVTQGNRVVTQSQVDPNNPVAVLEDKIRSHFDAVTPLVTEVRRAADELEQLLNRLRVGLN